MKKSIIAAVMAVFFTLILPVTAALAAEFDDQDEIIITEEPAAPEETPPVEETPQTESPSAAELPPVPPGTGTVIDYDTDAEGKLFYTIMTTDGHVFYLIIDKQNGADNVYFLNAVTVADLLPLAQIPETPAPAPAPPVTQPPVQTPPAAEQPAPAPPTPEQQKSGGNMGMMFILAAALICGLAAWYFKIYLPKQRRTSGGAEYEEEPEGGNPGDWDDGWDEDQGDDA
ncbi:MAG: DUF4366 domain-containing protein [Clostridiales bacterium]|nr:DUF4366 domain-containing protein [Clostridiales bacterium]